jgi:hypothetical protein
MTANNLELVFDHLNARRVTWHVWNRSSIQASFIEAFCPSLSVTTAPRSSRMSSGGFSRDDFGVDRLELIDAGERVVVGLAGPRFQEVPWAPLNGQIYVVYTVRDSHIVRMEDFLTRADAMAAAGGATKDWA